jgi:hypothetical protein
MSLEMSLDPDPSSPAGIERLVLPVKKFLLIEYCSEAWLKLDLYRMHDGQVTFYVGQSYNAFERVWRHIHEGFKGRSDPGRFIIVNWPVSMNFTIELLSSKSDRFCENGIGQNLNAAEQALIREYNPCFNIVLNRQPTPLPAQYLSPDQKPLRPRRLSGMIREAELSAKAEEKRRWLQGLDHAPES